METGKPCIYVVSGGSGASGEQLVLTALAQFPDARLLVVILPNVRHEEQIDAALDAAALEGSLVVHTLVDESLNQYLVKRAKEKGVSHINLMHDLLVKLSGMLGRPPVGHPGLYRKLHRAYFERIAAIEYTMAHDDGKDPSGWSEAEIILTGVSRVGKTPLSLYLSVLGWKVANVPLIPDLDPPQTLFQQDLRRLIGLTMHPGQLVFHRQHRQKRMGMPFPSLYADPQSVSSEVEFFANMLQQRGVTLIDVTDKPIETSADEVMRIITRRLGDQSRRESMNNSEVSKPVG